MHAAGCTRIDYNRCGVPLIEIVTRPDIHTGEEARAFVAAVARRLRYAGVCDGRMEQGSLRCDVNLSAARPGEPLGVRTEIKNLSSLRAVARAVEAEYRRQVSLLKAGRAVVQETRRFDEARGETISLRAKAEAQDYRYFPEPDLPPLRLEEADIKRLARGLPEMPEAREARYAAAGLSAEEARLLADHQELSDLFDRASALYPAPKTLASLLLTQLLRCMRETPSTRRLPAHELAGLVRLREEGRITAGGAKELLRILYTRGGDPETLARQEGFLLDGDTGDDGTFRQVIAGVLEENGRAAAQYRAGSRKVLGFLIGQACRALGRSADPVRVKAALQEALDAGELYPE